MITTQQMQDILALVDYKTDWAFHIGVMGTGDIIVSTYMQVQFIAGGETWRGRKWLLSPHMTEGEVVQTALMACLAAEEHEAREAFRYKGKALFGPHLSLQALLQVADDVAVRAVVA